MPSGANELCEILLEQDVLLLRVEVLSRHQLLHCGEVVVWKLLALVSYVLENLALLGLCVRRLLLLREVCHLGRSRCSLLSGSLLVPPHLAVLSQLQHSLLGWS